MVILRWLSVILIFVNFIFFLGAKLTIKYTIEDSELTQAMKDLMVEILNDFSFIFIINIIFIIIFILKKK